MKYYFDVAGALELRDEEGQECPTEGEARRAALIKLGELLRVFDGGREERGYVVEVFDACRQKIFEVRPIFS